MHLGIFDCKVQYPPFSWSEYFIEFHFLTNQPFRSELKIFLERKNQQQNYFSEEKITVISGQLSGFKSSAN